MSETKTGDPSIDTRDYELILDLLNIPKDSKQVVLDIGAGIGRVNLAANKAGLSNVQVILLDINYFKTPAVLEKVKEYAGGNVVAGDVFSLPIQSQSVDFSVLNGGPVASPKEYKDKIAAAIDEVTKTRVAVQDRSDQAHDNLERSTFAESLMELGWKVVKTEQHPVAGESMITVLEKNSQE